MPRFTETTAAMLKFAIELIGYQNIMVFDSDSSKFELATNASAAFAEMTRMEKHTFRVVFADGVKTLLKVLCSTYDIVMDEDDEDDMCVAIDNLTNLPGHVIDGQSVQGLQERLHCFAYVRTNFMARYVYPDQTLEIGGDMSNVYVPMLNTMMEIVMTAQA
jgi:hypothetical protein